MREQNNAPFVGKPVKTAYMWRDIERRAGLYGLQAKVPAPYPLQEFDLANRLAVLGLDEGWGKPYIMASYRRWFVDGQEPAMEANLSASLREVGQDRHAVERAGGRRDEPSFTRPRPTTRASSACSDRRPSPWGANSSGATTGWYPRFNGKIVTRETAADYAPFAVRKSATPSSTSPISSARKRFYTEVLGFKISDV